MPESQGMSPDELWRKSVADEFGGRIPPSTKRQLIVRREGLKHGRFAKGYGAMFLRMQESTLRRIDAAASDCRRNAVPGHPAIDVLEPISLGMAGQLVLFPEVLAASTVLRNQSDHGRDSRRPPFRRLVKHVVCSANSWHAGQRFAHCHGLRRPLADGGTTKSAGDDEQTASALRHPVLRNIHDLMAPLVSERAEVIDELVKHSVLSQSGHILCQERPWASGRARTV